MYHIITYKTSATMTENQLKHKGIFCIDFVQEPDPCKNNATCVDEINGFSCSCMPGWRGKICDQNINECEPGNNIISL